MRIYPILCRPALSRVTVLIIIISIIFPLSGLSETLSSPSGDPNMPVIVFKSEKAMAEGIKFLNSGGSVFNYKIFGQYVRAIPNSGTQCQILKSKFAEKQIRILDGPHAGKIGWVPSEMVR